ncbi:MAG: urease accessory protein UreD [Gammaproteobacteria bacterium]
MNVGCGVTTAQVTTAPVQLGLDFARDRAGVTRVVRRRVRYPYTFLKPFWFGDRPAGIATALIQSGSGGLYGGERLGQRIALGDGAAVHLTSQAAAVVHAQRGLGPTEQRVELELAAQTYLEYCPDPLILFPDAGLEQQIDVRLAADAVLIHADGIVRHDPGPGDRPFATYRSMLTVRSGDGRLLVRDHLVVNGQAFDRMLNVTNDGCWRGCGLLVAVAPARPDAHEAWCSVLNARLAALAAAAQGGIYAACAPLPNTAGIACRIVSRDGAGLRAALEACWRELRQVLTGSAAPRKRK